MIVYDNPFILVEMSLHLKLKLFAYDSPLIYFGKNKLQRDQMKFVKYIEINTIQIKLTKNNTKVYYVLTDVNRQIFVISWTTNSVKTHK